jgi:hypothetical protein
MDQNNIHIAILAQAQRLSRSNSNGVYADIVALFKMGVQPVQKTSEVGARRRCQPKRFRCMRRGR